MTGLHRYGPGARWYTTLSGERVLYRAGRVAALRALSLQRGDSVLDVGCGTGLNFPIVGAAIGPTGRIVGVDASVEMLRVARRRVDDAAIGTAPVRLVRADAVALNGALDSDDRFDAVVFAYSLSIIDSWESSWRQALDRVRPGGRIAVLDTAYPGGWARGLVPLVWIVFRLGGIHPRRRVWRMVQERTVDVVSGRLRAGHVRFAVGTKPGARPSGGKT